jgi:nicotinamide riboside transporter PnuC
MIKNPTINLLGWIGAMMVLIGYYLNAHQYISSWIIWIIGNGMVGAYSIHKNAYPTAAMSFIIMIASIYGYLSWSSSL